MRTPPRPPSALSRVGDHVLQQDTIYEKLPADIADRYVLLMDPIVGTGETAVKAVQVGLGA